MMQCNFAGRTLIKCSEGLRLDSYLDTGKVWTIGYGTTKIADIKVTCGMTISADQADLYLNRDLCFFENELNKLIKVELTENQFSALCCLVYNIGVGQFKTSTMLKKINARDFESAAQEFSRWVYDNGIRIKGLEQRRKKEKELFLKP
jgi:lysozyme